MIPHSISQAGLGLIQDHEGFHALPVQLPDGRWVVGYGHVRADAGELVSEPEAAALLRQDVAPFERVVNASVTEPLTQSQFDALVSFAFSVGAAAFAQSQVVRRLNASDVPAAACAMDAWRKSEVSGELEVVDALVRRRAAEKAMLLKDLGRQRAPSAFVGAKLDHAASILGAPSKCATLPELSAAPAAQPKSADVERLVEILKSEAQTEVLLLTQVVADEASDDGELVTAHAKPVARKIDVALPTLPLKHRGGDENTDEPRPFSAQWLRARVTPQALANAGLISLLLVGAVLIGVGAATLFEGRDDTVALAGGAALGGPGLAAVLFAGFGLLRAPYGKAAD